MLLGAIELRGGRAIRYEWAKWATAMITLGRKGRCEMAVVHEVVLLRTRPYHCTLDIVGSHQCDVILSGFIAPAR